LKQGSVKGSFHRQLTWVSSVGLLGLALAISLVSSEFLSRRLDGLALELLGELTGRLAKESRIIFLGSPDLAAARITEIAAFPGVRQAAVLKPDAEMWAMSDGADPWPPPLASSEWRTRPALADETSGDWYFAAPVRLETEVTPLATPRESQLLGYIAVVWRKEPLIALQGWLFVLNGGIALLLAVGISIGLQYFLRRLTGPLDQLAHVIQRLQQGEVGVRAAVAGPAEIREIGRMFNALLEGLERHRTELERHRIELESIVEIRTQELRAARDAALTAERYKSEFMAAMTHEMRTPLQSIMGYTQAGLREMRFLEDEADPVILGHLSKYLQIVLGASDELLSRINQVLELAALEAGNREIKPSLVDLPLLLDQMALIIRPLAEGNRNRLEVIHQGPSHVEMDEDKLRQIVRNLLDNACKFTHDGTVFLAVRSTTGGLTIEVRDSGIGIPAHQLDLIFEPFRQVDMSDTRCYGGTGLGLAITRNVCRLLGGEIAVDSTPAVGSCFRVTIPLPIRAALSGGRAAREPPETAVG
jgi:signal transduction histidine kinase